MDFRPTSELFSRSINPAPGHLLKCLRKWDSLCTKTDQSKIKPTGFSAPWGPHHIIENGPVPQGIYLFFITAFVITHGRCVRLRMDVCCLFHRVIVKMKPEIITYEEIIIHFFEFTGSRQRVIKNNFWKMNCTILIDLLSIAGLKMNAKTKQYSGCFLKNACIHKI